MSKGNGVTFYTGILNTESVINLNAKTACHSPGAAVKGYQKLASQVNKLIFAKSHVTEIYDI